MAAVVNAGIEGSSWLRPGLGGVGRGRKRGRCYSNRPRRRSYGESQGRWRAKGCSLQGALQELVRSSGGHEVRRRTQRIRRQLVEAQRDEVRPLTYFAFMSAVFLISPDFQTAIALFHGSERITSTRYEIITVTAVNLPHGRRTPRPSCLDPGIISQAPRLHLVINALCRWVCSVACRPRGASRYVILPLL